MLKIVLDRYLRKMLLCMYSLLFGYSVVRPLIYSTILRRCSKFHFAFFSSLLSLLTSLSLLCIFLDKITDKRERILEYLHLSEFFGDDLTFNFVFRKHSIGAAFERESLTSQNKIMPKAKVMSISSLFCLIKKLPPRLRVKYYVTV